MRALTFTLMCLVTLGCAGQSEPGGTPKPPRPNDGSFIALTYNVAGLPEGFSSSMPLTNTPLIGPLLNRYDLVLLQESWQTPVPNPLAPVRVFHEILVAASEHPYKSESAPQPLGADPSRPSALLGDGLNMFSKFPFTETTRVAWATCVETASDCLAFKGFSMSPLTVSSGLTIHVYNLHMEAGGSAADDTARAAGLAQMVAFIERESQGEALIVGGDFNLQTDREPAAGQLAQFREAVGLSDACDPCAAPGNIDKFLYRSGDKVALTASGWTLEEERFTSESGAPLSDHAPLSVKFRWEARGVRD